MPIPPPTPENQKVLDAAQAWFESRIIEKHRENTLKLLNEDEFKVNPFTVGYLAKFIGGEISAVNVAKALVYPRVLGASISTSFGTQMQRFITDTLVTAYGSAASGMDIDFKDRVDGIEKYAQLKLGPNTINRDDVDTIDGKFKSLRNLLNTNGRKLPNNNFVVGVMYGEERELSNFYRALRDDLGWELYVGREFWKRLTGDEHFMDRLIQVFQKCASDSAVSTTLERVIEGLASRPVIQALAKNFEFEN
jgi:Type II restriction endonuclease EcoO109I